MYSRTALQRTKGGMDAVTNIYHVLLTRLRILPCNGALDINYKLATIPVHKTSRKSVLGEKDCMKQRFPA